MNDNFIINPSGILTLNEVSDLLMMNSIQAVKKWLTSKKISINKFSKTNYVYEIEVVCEIQKQLALNLRRNYPSNWREMYKHIAPSDAVYNLVLIQIGEEVVYKPINKVKTKSLTDEKLLKELLLP